MAMPDRPTYPNAPAPIDNPRTHFPRPRVHHFLLWITVQAFVLAAFAEDLAKPQLSRAYAHYAASLFLWPAVTTAALIITWWRTRGVFEKWHPADALIVLPWCVFMFNTLTFNAWLRVSEVLNMSEEFFVTWFVVSAPAIGLAAVVFVAITARPRSALWLSCLGLISLESARRLLMICLEWVMPRTPAVENLHAAFSAPEKYIPLILLAAIAAAAWPSANRHLGWPRWALIIGSMSICVLEAAYWLLIMDG